MLVMTTLSLKLRKTRRGEERHLRFDVGKLRDLDVEKAFKIEVRNRFSILQDEQELTIESFNQVLTEVIKKVLDYGKKRKKDWITLNTWKTIDKRRKVKKKAQEAKSQRLKEQLQTSTYSELDREVKKRARADKKVFMEKLADEAEEATQNRIWPRCTR